VLYETGPYQFCFAHLALVMKAVRQQNDLQLGAGLVQQVHKHHHAIKRYLLGVVAVAIAFSALALVSYGQPSADEKLMSHDQDTIDGCWQEAEGTAITPAQLMVVVGSCQKLEEAYRAKHGTDPLPQTEGE
jgi:hypothetical protein